MIGGTGIGLAYLVPIATLVKWFPDRRGFIAGVAVAGFGAGALVTAPIATRLIQSIGVLHTFVWLGCTSLALVAGSAIFMVTPPTGWHPEGWKPAVSQGAASADGFTLQSSLATWQWYALWGIAILQRLGGNLHHQRSSADGSGGDRGQRQSIRRHHGRHHLYCQWRRTLCLGMAIGSGW